ncbi:hypothetical protein [Sinomicrobium soli]|uniref:hypothetical protein n=1 Tax=Sinomicrobium sp. N-1-3-6 TaxID=2219864 RepID=UPI000DCB25AF|nr:hypothetical protein [Sinomicrobium sp. N-1-3-6]RAV27459.1 hypothetical protein DN748_18470 [Sinomicrobium sp. N-1-3-6]
MSIVKEIDATVFSYYRNRSGNDFPENGQQPPPSPFIPENLTWILYLEDRRFEFLGTTSIFNHLERITFVNFVRLVPPYFVNSYLKGIGSFLALYMDRECNPEKNMQLQMLIPMKLDGGDYYYVKQTVFPKKKNRRLYALQLVNIPIKKYEKDFYKLEVLTSGMPDHLKTSYIKRRMAIHNLFSREQVRTISLIQEGLTSGEIAEKLNKTKAAAYKLNRRILEKISDCFEIEFDNVYQAVNFYMHCYEIR